MQLLQTAGMAPPTNVIVVSPTLKKTSVAHKGRGRASIWCVREIGRQGR